MTLPGYKQGLEHVSARIASRLQTLAERPLPVTKEWLECKYVDEKLDCTQIAALVARDPKTVWSWLKRCGIPTRRRGQNQARQFQAGAPSAFKGRAHSPETRENMRALRVADGRLPYLRNGRHWLKGKTGSASPAWRGGVTPERQSYYQTVEWKAACVAAWRRADARCQRCGADHRSPGARGSFHVHHIVSFMVRELRTEPTNLALLCGACHRFVHSRKNVRREFLAP